MSDPSNFPELVAMELAKARAKHRGIHSLHEGYAVVLEEMDEMWDEVRAQNLSRDKVLKELVQVAAMCQRMAEDCGLGFDPDWVLAVLVQAMACDPTPLRPRILPTQGGGFQ